MRCQPHDSVTLYKTIHLANRLALETFFLAGFEEVNICVRRPSSKELSSPLGVEGDFKSQPARNQSPHFYSSMKINFTNNLSELRNGLMPSGSCRGEHSSANTLMAALWNPEQRTQLSKACILTHRISEIINVYFLSHQIYTNLLCSNRQQIQSPYHISFSPAIPFFLLCLFFSMTYHHMTFFFLSISLPSFPPLNIRLKRIPKWICNSKNYFWLITKV